jgi:cytochrome c oxidase subunit IV
MDRPVSAAVPRALSRVFIDPSTLVFALLLIVTVLSFRVSGGAMNIDGARASALILAVAFIKTGLIIEYFMEIRHAPWMVRVGAVSWWLVVGAAVIATYLS